MEMGLDASILGQGWVPLKLDGFQSGSGEKQQLMTGLCFFLCMGWYGYTNQPKLGGVFFKYCFFFLIFIPIFGNDPI